MHTIKVNALQFVGARAILVECVLVFASGCSALAISSCDRFLVSGGCEGQIRVWKIEAKQQKLMAVLKEHTAPVGSLQFNCFDREVVSSSSDGTCIIWDMA